MMDLRKINALQGGGRKCVKIAGFVINDSYPVNSTTES
jgi:hypothetical protein